MGGEYQPIAITKIDDEHYWGHSDALKLDLCWEYGELRLYDPLGQRYLPNFQERDEQLRAAEAQRDTAEARANTEREARITAEARIRELEAQLHQQQSPRLPEPP